MLHSSTNPIAPEFNLLCLVARPKPDQFRAGAIVHAGLKWQRLLSLASAHGVRPHLIGALRALNWEGVPTDSRRSLLKFSSLHKVKTLLLADQLLKVADQLAQRAVRFATFKGPSLAAAVYGDLSLRECNDIDIIVDEQQIPEAIAVLGSLGYRPVYRNAAFRGAFLSYQRQLALVGRNPDLVIDLHWAFTATNVPVPITPREIWTNLETVEIGRQAVPTLSRSDLALFLAGHGTKEGWRTLGWICDFAMFIDRYPDLDWNHLLSRARHKGCGRSLLLGCQLAAQVLGTRVKGNLIKLAENTTDCRLAAEAAVRRVRDESLPLSSERFLGDIVLCETRVQKGRVILGLLLTRTVGDYISMPLPRSLWRVYHVTRLFRLAGKAIAGWTRSLSQRRKKFFWP
jgi:hypothetical protein